MTWLALLARFWKPIAGALVVLCIVLAIRGYGEHRYESGYAASEAKWRPLFAAAEHAKKEADEKARRTEEYSKALSDQIEKQHAQTVASLNLRAADAESRYASLMRQYAASSRCVAVPKAGRATGDTDAASASERRDERASRDFARLARRCEADAATLTDLQHWIAEQRAIFLGPMNEVSQ